MSSIYDWSATPGSNTSVGGVNIAEGMSPALVNDAMRQIMAIVRQTLDPSLQTFLVNSSPLALANGGTGATSASAALTALGGLPSTYRDIVPISKTSAFTFADTERGQGINYSGAAAAATINPNATTAITIGATYVIMNTGTGALTITRGAGVTLNKNGSTTSSDAVLAQGGVATLIKWATDFWTITGSGLS